MDYCEMRSIADNIGPSIAPSANLRRIGKPADRREQITLMHAEVAVLARAPLASATKSDADTVIDSVCERLGAIYRSLASYAARHGFPHAALCAAREAARHAYIFDRRSTAESIRAGQDAGWAALPESAA